MQTGFSRYGDYKIEKLSLMTKEGVAYDIRKLALEISIYENMFSSSLTGYVQILDAKGLLNSLEIRGGERISLSFSTNTKSQITGEFIVYKVSDIEVMDGAKTTYRLFFTTPEKMVDMNMRVSSYYSGLVSEIVPKIMQELGSDKKVFIDLTTHTNGIIIPNLTPLSAVSWLLNRAIDANTSNAGFFFYETLDGYHFKSFEELIKNDAVMQYSQKTVSKVNKPNVTGGGDETAPTKNFKDKKQDPADHIQNLFTTPSDYNIRDRYSLIDKSKKGMFSGKEFKLDIYNKSMKVNTFSRDSVESIEGTNPFPDALISHPDSHHAVSMIHSNRSTEHDEYENHLSRKSIVSGVNYSSVLLTVSGNSDLRAGSMIDYDVPNHSTSKETIDKAISGKRVVFAVRHILGLNKYTQVIECNKDSLQEM